MITKERLQELIEQEAMIYTITINNRLDYFRLKKDWYVMNDELREYKLSKHAFRHWWIGNLYENKEDAEWIIEFGCIERTERLELPTWEEFLELSRHDINFHFITKDREINYIVIGNDIYMHNDMLKPKDEWTIVIHNEDDEYIFEKPATKENYTIACERARELFLGEKK